MITRNRKVIALEYEPAGSDEHVDFRTFRAACDRFMRKRNMFKAKLVPPSRRRAAK